MSEVKKVMVQLREPRGSDPGAVVLGFYIVKDNTVIMTDADGNEAGLETGRRFTHRLQESEDARSWACKMTKELRLAFQGSDGGSVHGFSGPIQYPKFVV